MDTPNLHFYLFIADGQQDTPDLTQNEKPWTERKRGKIHTCSSYYNIAAGIQITGPAAGNPLLYNSFSVRSIFEDFR